MELSSTPPKHNPIMPSTSPSGQLRVLTSSNSFDSKSNIPNFGRFQMSAEATKLFNTLQQSPLPINPEVNFYPDYLMFFQLIKKKTYFSHVMPTTNQLHTIQNKTHQNRQHCQPKTIYRNSGTYFKIKTSSKANKYNLHSILQGSHDQRSIATI